MCAAYFDTGFSVREPAWHGHGLVLDDYPTDWNDARKKAGLLWEPSIRPVYETVGLPTCFGCSEPMGARHSIGCRIVGRFLDETIPTVTSADTDRLFTEIPSYRRVVRDDNEQTLAVVSDQFSLISHDMMGQIVESILDLDSAVKFETAGSCREGRQVWALAYLDEPYTVPGDDTEHLPFLALLNSHDGTGACKVTMTQVRVVCWNTFQMASTEGDRHGRQFSFRHVGDVASRIEDAKLALRGLRTERDDYLALAADLCAIKVDDDGLSRYLSEFLPDPAENGEVVSERVSANVAKARSAFRTLYLDSVTTDAVRGTAWGLVQASTEYLDHVRDYRTPDSYLGRSILRAEPAKAKALSIVRRVCK